MSLVLLDWLMKAATHPTVVRVLLPRLAEALGQYFARKAGQVEVKTAVRVARAAKTAEDLRLASQRLTDAANRR